MTDKQREALGMKQTSHGMKQNAPYANTTRGRVMTDSAICPACYGNGMYEDCPTCRPAADALRGFIPADEWPTKSGLYRVKCAWSCGADERVMSWDETNRENSMLRWQDVSANEWERME